MQSKMAPWAFVLAVPDMNRSAEYFREVLGFRTSWQDATDWRLAERDQDLGFTVAWSSDGLAYIQHGNTSFLLQEFPKGIENFMMHLLVQDVDAWWSHVQDQGIVGKYGVMIEPVSDKPWGLRDFAISDPSYVLWRIGQNIPIS